MRKIVVSGIAAILLAACAAQTPYGPATGSWGYGYDDTQIEEDRYRVSFRGNSLTDLNTVETYLLYRAAELTLQTGYDWFEVVGSNVDADRRLSGSTSSFGYFGYGYGLRYYHPRFGWSPYSRGFNDINVREITRYEAIAEVRFGRGAKPGANPRAYDAADVQRNLSSQIVLPPV